MRESLERADFEGLGCRRCELGRLGAAWCAWRGPVWDGVVLGRRAGGFCGVERFCPSAGLGAGCWGGAGARRRGSCGGGALRCGGVRGRAGVSRDDGARCAGGVPVLLWCFGAGGRCWSWAVRCCGAALPRCRAAVLLGEGGERRCWGCWLWCCGGAACRAAGLRDDCAADRWRMRCGGVLGRRCFWGVRLGDGEIFIFL